MLDMNTICVMLCDVYIYICSRQVGLNLDCARGSPFYAMSFGCLGLRQQAQHVILGRMPVIPRIHLPPDDDEGPCLDIDHPIIAVVGPGLAGPAVRRLSFSSPPGPAAAAPPLGAVDSDMDFFSDMDGIETIDMEARAAAEAAAAEAAAAKHEEGIDILLDLQLNLTACKCSKECISNLTRKQKQQTKEMRGVLAGPDKEIVLFTLVKES